MVNLPNVKCHYTDHEHVWFSNSTSGCYECEYCCKISINSNDVIRLVWDYIDLLKGTSGSAVPLERLSYAIVQYLWEESQKPKIALGLFKNDEERIEESKLGWYKDLLDREAKCQKLRTVPVPLSDVLSAQGSCTSPHGPTEETDQQLSGTAQHSDASEAPTSLNSSPPDCMQRTSAQHTGDWTYGP